MMAIVSFVLFCLKIRKRKTNVFICKKEKEEGKFCLFVNFNKEGQEFEGQLRKKERKKKKKMIEFDFVYLFVLFFLFWTCRLTTMKWSCVKVMVSK